MTWKRGPCLPENSLYSGYPRRMREVTWKRYQRCLFKHISPICMRRPGEITRVSGCRSVFWSSGKLKRNLCGNFGALGLFLQSIGDVCDSVVSILPRYRCRLSLIMSWCSQVCRQGAIERTRVKPRGVYCPHAASTENKSTGTRPVNVCRETL